MSGECQEVLTQSSLSHNPPKSAVCAKLVLTYWSLYRGEGDQVAGGLGI